MYKSKSQNTKKPVTVFNQRFEIQILLNVDEIKSRLLEVDNKQYSFASRFHTQLLTFDGQDVFAIRLGHGRGNTWFIGLIEETANGVLLTGQIGISLEVLLALFVGIVLFIVFGAAFLQTQRIAALCLAVGLLGITIGLTRYTVEWQRQQMKNVLLRIFSGNYIAVT